MSWKRSSIKSNRMFPKEFNRYIVKRNPIQLAYHDRKTVNACSNIVKEVPDLEEASYNLFESWLQACDPNPTAFLITVRNLNAGDWYVTVDESGLPPTDPELCERTPQWWKDEHSKCHSPLYHHHHQLRAILDAAPDNGAEILQRSHNLEMGGNMISEDKIICLGEMSAIKKTAFEMSRVNIKRHTPKRISRWRKMWFR